MGGPVFGGHACIAIVNMWTDEMSILQNVHGMAPFALIIQDACLQNYCGVVDCTRNDAGAYLGKGPSFTGGPERELGGVSAG